MTEDEREVLKDMLKECLDKPDTMISHIASGHFAKLLAFILHLDSRVTYLENKARYAERRH